MMAIGLMQKMKGGSYENGKRVQDARELQRCILQKIKWEKYQPMQVCPQKATAEVEDPE